MPQDLDIVTTYQKILPVDVFGMAEALGLHVSTQSIDESGRMQNIRGTWCIVINVNDGPQRQRFTLAHMIAHYLLHRDLMGHERHVDILYDGADNNPSAPLSPYFETQANRQAAQIMMPANTVRAHKDLPLKDLASLFGVSQKAMAIRLDHLTHMIA